MCVYVCMYVCMYKCRYVCVGMRVCAPMTDKSSTLIAPDARNCPEECPTMETESRRNMSRSAWISASSNCAISL